MLDELWGPSESLCLTVSSAQLGTWIRMVHMSDDVTQILGALSSGDPEAAEQLLEIIHGELHRIASSKLRGEAAGHTLQTTALVNEAYLRLLGSTAGPRETDRAPGARANTESTTATDEDTSAETDGSSWNSRGHFFAAAAEAMRRILIDHARGKNRLKRGGGRDRVDLEFVELALPGPNIDLLALDEALTRLEAADAEKADVVKLRYFAGLTIEQTANVLDLSIATVKRHWSYARVWLRREIEK